MILINQHEKDIILERLPKTHMRRTVKQKSGRHRYYMEETKPAMALLYKIRNGKMPRKE